MRCTRCGRDAPTVQRGLSWFCSACGAERIPIGVGSVDHAGKGSRYGGCALLAIGALILFVGISVAAVVGALLAWIFPASALAWIVGSIIGLATLALGGGLVWSGRSLRKQGDSRSETVKNQAIFAHAAARHGVLRPRHVARLLSITPEAADELLTHLAKTRADDVQLEIDERGEVYYLFPAFAPPGPRYRVELDVPATGASRSKQRVADAAALAEADLEEAAVDEAERAEAPLKTRR